MERKWASWSVVVVASLAALMSAALGGAREKALNWLFAGVPFCLALLAAAYGLVRRARW